MRQLPKSCHENGKGFGIGISPCKGVNDVVVVQVGPISCTPQRWRMIFEECRGGHQLNAVNEVRLPEQVRPGDRDPGIPFLHQLDGSAPLEKAGTEHRGISGCISIDESIRRS